MDRLAGRFHTLAADLYGSGQSPAWSGERPLWLADEVALLAPVFAAAGHLAPLTHPERVNALIDRFLDIANT